MAKRDVARTSESPFRIENRSVRIRWKKLVDDFLSRGKSSKDAVECCFAGRIHIFEDKLVIRVRLAAIPTEEDGKTISALSRPNGPLTMMVRGPAR